MSTYCFYTVDNYIKKIPTKLYGLLGILLTSYHRSDSKIERKNADNLLDYTEFYKRCTQRGYGEFDLGDTIEVDVSDYEKIEYPKILQWLEDRVWKNRGILILLFFASFNLSIMDSLLWANIKQAIIKETHWS